PAGIAGRARRAVPAPAHRRAIRTNRAALRAAPAMCCTTPRRPVVRRDLRAPDRARPATAGRHGARPGPRRRWQLETGVTPHLAMPRPTLRPTTGHEAHDSWSAWSSSRLAGEPAGTAPCHLHTTAREVKRESESAFLDPIECANSRGSSVLERQPKARVR